MLLFALSLFCSSFLLFLIQPLIGKYILPWFGSSPAVWSASLLFFQIMLTGGYVYAYALTGRFSPRRQRQVHLVVLSISLVGILIGVIYWTAPLLPGIGWQPKTGSIGGTVAPFWDVMKVLAVAVGLPYLLLATNSTLLQAWFTKIYPGRSPYRLYALSNVASLLGLISYPLLFEPLLPITTQARWWVAGYVGYCLTDIGLAYRFFRQPSINMRLEIEVGENPVLPDKPPSAPGWSIRLLWVILPAIASTLLLASTNRITQEIAVIPFLWVLPLTLYLISFILCFESDRWYGRVRFGLMLVISTGVYGLVADKGPLVDLRIQISAYCLLLFVCCMVCHGELTRLRPHPQHLTSFYLLVSIGGAIGGLFVNLASPVLFPYYWELEIGLLACFFVFLLLIIFISQGRSWKISLPLSVLILGVMIWMAVFTVKDIRSLMNNSLWVNRNFYGVLRIKQVKIGPDEVPANQLVHGITIHGLQFIGPEKRDQATTYYSPASGAGVALGYLMDRQPNLRVAILGLGTGTLAVYGRHGDIFRFYEINPAVVQIAQGEGGYFSFLQDSRADIEIVLGDARLSLQRELVSSGSQEYDLMLLDTFSSDAIPVHLLTNQAFQVYLQHLKQRGILAVHISNIHLDLRPVVYSQAKYFGLKCALISTGKTILGSTGSQWMLLTDDAQFLELPDVQPNVIGSEQLPFQVKLWTDDFSNLIQILR